FGTTRASHDTIHHIHESPKSITFPLIVLAVLSAVGGFMGVPEALGGSHWLSNFLAPVFAPSKELIEALHVGQPLSHSDEDMLMGLIVGLTAVFIFYAYSRYVSKGH